MSSEKHLKPDSLADAFDRDDTLDFELEERDLFAAWEPPSLEPLDNEPLDNEPTRVIVRPTPPPLPPSSEIAAPVIAEVAVTSSSSSNMSSLAPTVREQPARKPERRSSARPLIMGLLAFAAAGALWLGMPHPDATQVSAPHAAAIGTVDSKPAAPPSEAQPVQAVEQPSAAPAPAIVVPAVTIDRAPAIAPSTALRPTPRARSVRRSKQPLSSSGPLPDAPRREDVIGALNQLRGKFASCSAGRSGVAEIDLTIAGNGAVTNALISGDFAGTPQGSCLARAIRGAHFAPFAQPRSRILYRMAL